MMASSYSSPQQQQQHSSLFTFVPFGQLWGRVATIYQARWLLLTQFAVVVMIPFEAIMITATRIVIESNAIAQQTAAGQEITTDTADLYLHHMKVQSVLMAIEIALYVLVCVPVQASLIHVVAQFYANSSGNNVTFMTALRVGLHRFCPIIGYGCLCALGVLAYFLVLGLVAGVFVALKITPLAVIVVIIAMAVLYYVAIGILMGVPVLIIENCGPVTAIKRSWELTESHRWYLFCGMFVLLFGQQLVMTLWRAVLMNALGANVVVSFLTGLPMLVFLPMVVM